MHRKTQRTLQCFKMAPASQIQACFFLYPTKLKWDVVNAASIAMSLNNPHMQFIKSIISVPTKVFYNITLTF